MSALVKIKGATKPAIKRLAAKCLAELPQTECPVVNRFAPGIYARELLMPAGNLVIGAEHRTAHLNIMLTGRATLLVNGVAREVVAPFICKSEPGVMKVAIVHEDCRWLTIHPTNERNLRKLEKLLTVDFPPKPTRKALR
jgi:hypothetical protein